MDRVTEEIKTNYRPTRAKHWPPRWLPDLSPVVAVGLWTAFLAVVVAMAIFAYPVLVEIFGRPVALGACGLVGAAFGYIVLTLFRIWRKVSADDDKVTTRRGTQE